MATAEKTVSALINRQLPDFVRADHPQFKRFLELYYTWLEDETKGNTVYHIMNSGKYRDVDETLDPFIRLFKQELLPYFPENSELDLVKILKGAREFYIKKGSEESVKWLFRVLYGEDINVYYPKQQILIASDGKWKLPQAFQLTLSAANQNIDVNLLEKHKATGSISKATCIIESANKTIDRTFGTEILEMYVSNVFRSFTNGEDLEIPYVDENGVEQLFSEKIIGSISNIVVDSQIRTDPQQKRRGLSYNVGDPVIVFGGLAATAEANDAVAVVGNVTVGSIEGLSVVFGGYGYRTYSNTEAIVYRSVGDDPNANLSTDIRVAGITTFDDTANTNAKFLEYIVVDKMPIEYAASQVLSNTGDWVLFSSNARNVLLTITGTPGSGSAKWHQYEDWYADSNGSYQTANIVGKIITSNAAWVGGPAQVVMYAVQNTKPLTILTGNTITTTNSLRNYTVSSVDDIEMSINANSSICQALNFERIETGGVALYNILNGGYGFRSTPVIRTESYHDTYLSEAYEYGTQDYANSRQLLSATGQIAHIYIDNPGTGYANGDALTVIGSGYGFTGNVTVGANGAIVAATIINRGEGYYNAKSVSVTTSGGANASLSAYGFGEGVEVGVETGAIGRVKDVRMISRGFDYIDTPIVSFKVVDMIIDGILEAESLSEGERVYQGPTLETATFQGIIKSYNRSTRLLRLFNYSGNSFGSFNKSLQFTSEGGVTFFVDQAAKVPAPSSYPAEIRAVGLDNPWFYGNGKAKGYAEFYNGLIKFTGFYLNTDGFLSSDKKLQDSKQYHNYSYVIESEKSLSDYSNSMKDIVHPIGMVMLGRTISKSELTESITPVSVVSTIPYVNANATVTVSNSYNVVVTGANSLFTLTAAVGDILLIADPIAPLRSQAKIIKFITSPTSLNVESNFVMIGQGKASTNSGNNLLQISGNTNSVSDFIATGDVVRINVGNIELYSVTAVSGNVVSLNNTANTSNTGLVYQVVPVYTETTYEIIKVTE
jgi:hypothetical protein